MTKNLLAGIGDPYWYEWSIGVYYALDMLDSNSGIESVTLQASAFQGLDDVIVRYKNNDILGIQIKHTRENSSLTFADLIYSTKSGRSLLAEICRDWEKMKSSNNITTCSAILFTNRKGGIRKSTIKGKDNNPIEYPPLVKFWCHIKKQSLCQDNIDDIIIPDNWNKAWELFLKELNILDKKDKLQFLKQFELKTDQDDLDTFIEGIEQKLFDYFHANKHQIKNLDQRLCYAIRDWSTTRRKDERITREDLFEALSLVQDMPSGEHNLPVCNPFFHSRIEFINKLESSLKKREKPIIFLSGSPGSGKTNIVSYLANKADSVIVLRFHAFKPIEPTDKYLPSDKGISNAKDFWGDLLIQLREIFLGKLAECNVPISNEILGNAEKIRAEVLRLSELYGRLNNKITVIAVDGIDHAARAGEKNNFLKTLIPSSAVPDNVCFLIAGQPLEYYDLYPDWLSDSGQILYYSVPNIETSDIIQLLSQLHISLIDCSIERVAQIILSYVKGNTLSAVFATYECRNISTISELESKLNASSISSGIQAYYEYIWKESKKQIPTEYWYIDARIATILTMFTKRIPVNKLTEIFIDIPLSKIVWERIMDSLFPIIIKDDSGYRIFHNDVRIYLEKYIRKNLQEFENICGQIADYLFEKELDPNIKHELGFKLLKLSGKEGQCIDHFTTDYVLEAILAKRPLQEISKQVGDAVSSIRSSKDYHTLFTFACAIETLSQYQQSLSWQDIKHVEEHELPVVLPCEKKISSKESFDTSNIRQMFIQLNWLIEYNEVNRAKDMLNRWLGDFTPYALIQQLANNDSTTIDENYISNESVSDLLINWGKFCYILNINFQFDSKDSHIINLTNAYWTSGWIKEAQIRCPNDIIKHFENKDTPYFISDIENVFIALLTSESSSKILSVVKSYPIEKFSCRTKLHWICWAAINKPEELPIDILSELLEKRLDFLEIESSNKYNETNFLCCAMIAFILSIYQKMDVTEFDTFVSYALQKSRGYVIKNTDRGYFSGNNLILSSILLGQVLTNPHSKKLEESIRVIVESIFDNRDGIGCAEINGKYVKKYLLSILIKISNKFTTSQQKYLLNSIIAGAYDVDDLVTLDIWWDYLVDQKQLDVLQDIFDKWMDLSNGLAWKGELYETHNIANVFFPLATDLGWVDKIQKIQKVLEYNKIGYIGRKDYSLYKPLNWFESLDYKEITWNNPGIHFLNISEYASETGDNRAAVRIKGAVASVVGHYGESAINAFIKVINPKEINEFNIIIDAIIASFENCTFNNNEIIEIWKMAVKIYDIDHSMPEYNSDNSSNIIYLIDLREAIFEYLAQNDLEVIKDSLKDIAPLEFELEKGPETIMFCLPDRWYNKKIENNFTTEFLKNAQGLSLFEMFEYICNLIRNENNHQRWNLTIGFIEILKQDSQKNHQYFSDIFKLTIENRRLEMWNSDGIDRLYEKLFPFLCEDDKYQLLEELVKHYEYNKRYSDVDEMENLYSFSDDIHKLLFWHASILTTADKMFSLSNLLDTHYTWITASGKRIFPMKYEENVPILKNTTWHQVCEELYQCFK